MEKIDKMREVAGNILQKLLKMRWNLDQTGEVKFEDDFPDKELLLNLFVHFKFYDEDVSDYEMISRTPWRNPSFVFHHVAPLLDSDHFREGVIKGIISSSGGLTESTL